LVSLQQRFLDEAKASDKAPRPRLIGVVHERLGVDEFREKYFKGELYLDEEKNLFKAIGNRWMGYISGLMSSAFYANLKRVQSKGIAGNIVGEGRQLGGLLVVGPGEQGVLLQYAEKVWGDHCALEVVADAVKKMQPPVSGATVLPCLISYAPLTPPSSSTTQSSAATQSEATQSSTETQSSTSTSTSTPSGTMPPSTPDTSHATGSCDGDVCKRPPKK